MSAAIPITSWGTVSTFMTKGTCSHTLFCVLNGALAHPRPDEEAASDPLAGGIVQHGYQCGMLWGATLAAGAQAFRQFGAGPDAHAAAIRAAQRVVESFRAQNHATDCRDITGMNDTVTPWQTFVYFFLKGGTIGCFRMAARYAPLAMREVQAALAEKLPAPQSGPVSCAALLAKKMGASDEHAVMASGLAGGIGLSGGGCGALGAAIWLAGLEDRQRGEKVEFKSKRALDIIARFSQCTGGEFECAKITGRRFADTADHAAFLRDGGCTNIIDALKL